MTEQEKAERQKREAESYREMEGDLHDVVNMGRIAAKLISESDGEAGVQKSVALFAVYHLEDTLVAFEEKYRGGGWRRGAP